jgi:hypothetical protein
VSVGTLVYQSLKRLAEMSGRRVQTEKGSPEAARADESTTRLSRPAAETGLGKP